MREFGALSIAPMRLHSRTELSAKQPWSVQGRLLLVAQCSAIGVSVAATPPVARSVFGRKLSRFRCDTSPMQSYVFSLQITPNTTATGGVGKQVRHGLLGGAGVARHSCDISKIAGICRDTVCATLCSAIGVRARVCH